MSRPDITFFCELEPQALTTLFQTPGLIEHLQAHNYSIALGMLDFGSQRAAVVRQLNTYGIPTIAWLLLPHDQGYWFNLGNYPQAIARYHAFREWANQEQLHFGAVGLDIEPSLSTLQAARIHGVRHLWSRAFLAQVNALYPAARAAYQDLTARIRHDGYNVHTYQYPFIVDDRRAGTTLIQRILDIVDLPADEEVLMLYSSLFLPHIFGTDFGGAFVRSYAPHADGIAIGVTGGGVVLDPLTGEQVPCMSLDAFRRDLRIAAQYTDHIHIFSLEGCVERDWLGELTTLDWEKSAVVGRLSRIQMSVLRNALRFVLWCSRYGWTALGWLGWLVAAGLIISRRINRWRAPR